MTTTAPTGEKGMSLSAFVRAERRAECSVCALEDETRRQMRGASKKKIGVDTVLRWLEQCYGVTISRDDYTTHQAAHHDQRDEIQ